MSKNATNHVGNNVGPAGSCPPASRIAVTVNGQQVTLPVGATVAALMMELGLGTQAVAVELNLDLIPKARHRDTMLGDGDRVEVVTLVGGG